MEKIKEIVNHPLSKAIAIGIIGSILLLEVHKLYAGLAFGLLRDQRFQKIQDYISYASNLCSTTTVAQYYCNTIALIQLQRLQSGARRPWPRAHRPRTAPHRL